MTLTRFTMDTLIATSPLFDGLPLRSFEALREAGDPAGLLRLGGVEDPARTRPTVPPQAFAFGSIDFMPFRDHDARRFQIVEFNGTGSGSITVLPEAALEHVLEAVAASAGAVPASDPLVLIVVPSRHKRAAVHERILVAQAAAEGLSRTGRRARLAVLDHSAPPPGPCVVLGYPGQLRDELEARDGHLSLRGRVVDAVIPDLYCRRLEERFRSLLVPEAFASINGIARITSDKHETYGVYNEVCADLARGAATGDVRSGDLLRFLGRPVKSWRAHSPEDLISTVSNRLAEGTSVVLKPLAGGGGRGVEFIDAQTTPANAVAQVQRSIDRARRSSREPAADPSFPYTVCEQLDAVPIECRGHRFDGHRFEVRVYVYRTAGGIRAVPAVCKISRARFDRSQPTPEMWVTTNSERPGERTGGAPELCCSLRTPDSLELLGLTTHDLDVLSDVAERCATTAAGVFANALEGALR